MYCKRRLQDDELNVLLWTYVVVAVEADKQDRHSGRQEQQTVLRECVGVQVSTPIAHADSVQGGLVASIQRSEIDVGRSLVDVDVVMGGTEYTSSDISIPSDCKICEDVRVDDERGKGEHQAGETSRVLGELQ